MAWLILVAIAVATLGALWATGLRGPLLTLAAAALAFGGAGYALTGRPGLEGSPRHAGTRAPPIPLDVPRGQLMGNFNAADRWLIIADSFERRGNTKDAVGILRRAAELHPQDYQLWVGLGNVLTDHARGYTPAAEYAFDRAARLAPHHPAPPFFKGLALVRSGRIDEGVALWRAVLAEAPANASWRPLIADALLAVTGANEAAPAN